jgi:hypothetical protein
MYYIVILWYIIMPAKGYSQVISFLSFSFFILFYLFICPYLFPLEHITNHSRWSTKRIELTVLNSDQRGRMYKNQTVTIFGFTNKAHIHHINSDQTTLIFLVFHFSYFLFLFLFLFSFNFICLFVLIYSPLNT